MITALKCSGLSHAFRCVEEKNKNVIHQPRSVRIERTMPSVLSTQVSWVSKTSGTVFPNTDLPAGDFFTCHVLKNVVRAIEGKIIHKITRREITIGSS